MRKKRSRIIRYTLYGKRNNFLKASIQFPAKIFQGIYSRHLFLLFMNDVQGLTGKQVVKVIEYLFFVCDSINTQDTFSSCRVALCMWMYHIQNHLTNWNFKPPESLDKITRLIVGHFSGNGDGNKERLFIVTEQGQKLLNLFCQIDQKGRK